MGDVAAVQAFQRAGPPPQPLLDLIWPTGQNHRCVYGGNTSSVYRGNTSSDAGIIEEQTQPRAAANSLQRKLAHLNMQHVQMRPV